MKKKLPYICITSVGNTYEEKLDSLIQIEPVLVYLGYDEPDDGWNNRACNIRRAKCTDTIICHTNHEIGYHTERSFVFDYDCRFKATQLKEIINYVLNYKHNGK